MKGQLTSCLWFDNQAKEAANFYVSVFKNSGIDQITYYPNAGQEIHHQQAGSVMTVTFHINDQSFRALNSGPIFKFN